MFKLRLRRALASSAALALVAFGAVFVSAATASAVSGSTIAQDARAQLGNGPCGAGGYYAHGTAQTSSCANGGEAHEWCADFAGWVWQQAGVTDFSTDLTYDGNHTIDNGASSFYNYGQKHGTVSMTPAVGDVVVYNYGTGGNPPNWASHAAIVVQVNSNGTVDTVGGNSGGGQGAVQTDNNEPRTGTTSWGDTISGYIAPVGGSGGGSTTNIDQWTPGNTCSNAGFQFCLWYAQGQGTGGAGWGGRGSVGTISGTFTIGGSSQAGYGQAVRNNAASMTNVTSNCNVTVWVSPNYTGDFNWLHPDKAGNLTSNLRNNEASISANNCT